MKKRIRTRLFVVGPEGLPDLTGMMLATIEALKAIGGSATIEELVEKIVEMRVSPKKSNP